MGSAIANNQESLLRLSRPTISAQALALRSTGRIMGRAVARGGSGAAVLMQYRQDMLVGPLGGHLGGQGSLQSTGLSWATNYIYYSGPNCTGQLSIPSSVFALGGTRSATPERRGNQWVLLVGAGRNPQRVPASAIQSASFGGSGCFNSQFQGDQEVYPVQEVLPLDPVGIPPFFYR